MKKRSLFLAVAMILSIIGITFSCSKDELPRNQNTGDDKKPEESNTIISLNWDDHDEGEYKTAIARRDFGSATGWQPSRVSIANKAVKVTMLANELSGSGGIVSRMDLEPAEGYKVTFNVMFPADFIWGRGGKVGFGFRIGKGYTGCNKADAGDGGSARIMWYTNDSGVTTLRPYLYYYDMPKDCGHSPESFPMNGSIQTGKWYKIEMTVRSNLADTKNGRIIVVIDGSTVMNEAIRWTNTVDNNRLINQLSFATFRGGSEDRWKVDEDTSIYFDNLVVEKIQ